MIELRLSEAAKFIGGAFEGIDKAFRGVSTDTRKIRENELFIALKGLNFNGNDFVNEAFTKGAAGCIVGYEKKKDKQSIFVDDTRIALGKLAYYWREEMPSKIIAITGSNGKTSLKELLASCISIKANTLSTEGNLNNDIGLPLMLLKLNSSYEFSVLEMGANRPKEIEYLVNLANPHVVVINNAAIAHIEGFNDLNGVAKAKGEILQGRVAPKYAILNYDDAYFSLWNEMAINSEVISFGLNSKAMIYAKNIQIQKEFSHFHLILPDDSIDIRLKLPGNHNIMNACAAGAVMYSLGRSSREIKEGLEKVSSVTGRLQLMDSRSGHTIINDSYNANPTSTVAAIEYLKSMSNKKIFVFGDMKELGDNSNDMHAVIGEKARNMGIDYLYAVGEMTKYTVKEFGNNGFWFTSIDELIANLRSMMRDNKNMSILVKGSRSMRMERVVSQIV